jgi:hypothetical protein
MLVQYLVGLCCLKWHPDDVTVTVGDMVVDAAAGKKRDVDVTVTVAGSAGITHAFKAYEVKHEGQPLDVAVVEQLVIKLNDMPAVTHKAVVSSSGFTTGAKTKAKYHGVKLYDIRPWTKPLQDQFPALTMTGTPTECFPMSSVLLCWTDVSFQIVSPQAKSNFQVSATDTIFNKAGKKHPIYKTFGSFADDMLFRSTSILYQVEPASTVMRTFPVPYPSAEREVGVGPQWPHTHTLDVRGDGIFVVTDEARVQVEALTINGNLQWQREPGALYYVMEDAMTGEAFAGALIANKPRQGNMIALVLTPDSRNIRIEFVNLTHEQKNFINGLTLTN